MLEGVLARGDRKVAAVVEEAYRKWRPLRFLGSENFDNDLWMKAFETCGVDPDFYTTFVSEAWMKCSRGISSTRV